MQAKLKEPIHLSGAWTLIKLLGQGLILVIKLTVSFFIIYIENNPSVWFSLGRFCLSLNQ